MSKIVTITCGRTRARADQFQMGGHSGLQRPSLGIELFVFRDHVVVELDQTALIGLRIF
jgi:hypothetical protein